MLRVGYSYWGFLGDHKIEGGVPVSMPDGNATYSWSIISELHRRRYGVYQMQVDRDKEGWEKYGPSLFSSFSPLKREVAYTGMARTDGVTFPELDVLLLEWRFPIFGRNCCSWEGQPCFPSDAKSGSPIMATGYADKKIELHPDLFRQYELLRHYKKTKTKIIFWDLDHKVLLQDEEYYKPDAVFETSAKPLLLKKERTRVEFPTIVGDLLQYKTLSANPLRKSVYIGSRYERDDVITEWMKPLSDRFPGQVEFWGNWLKTVDQCKKLWPNVSYNDRITTTDFRRVYGEAVSVPLLAKKSYLETGFITPRPWEAILFGSLPIGLATATGIEAYTKFVAKDPQDMISLASALSSISLTERDIARQEIAHKLSHMDAKHFVDRIEDVVNEVSDPGEDLVIEQGAT